jgi:tRNA 2-thiouridine synthesizing protein A
VSIVTVDATGERCPAPILAIAKALKENPTKKLFLLLSDDPATSPDIHAWARMTGNNVEICGGGKFEITRKVPT